MLFAMLTGDTGKLHCIPGLASVYAADQRLTLDFRYQADNVYALNTVYFLCAVIGVFAVANLLVRFCPLWLKRTWAWRTTTSLSRFMAYRGYRFPALRYWSPSLGVLALGVLGTIFFFGMTDGWSRW